MIKKLLSFFQKLSKREKLILYVVCAVLGVLAADQLVAGPVLRKLVSLDRDVRDEETIIKKSLEITLRKSQLSSDSKQLAIFSLDPEEVGQEMNTFLKEIENIANRSSVNLLYVKPSSSQEAGEVKKYLATLECEASMESVASFFHNLENSTKLLQIEKYSIVPKNKTSALARCSMTVSRTVLNS